MPQAESGKGYISTEGLAIFDKFGAAQKGDPRTHLLKGAKLQELVDHLKAQEPFLTTTRAIPTSADRWHFWQHHGDVLRQHRQAARSISGIGCRAEQDLEFRRCACFLILFAQALRSSLAAGWIKQPRRI